MKSWQKPYGVAGQGSGPIILYYVILNELIHLVSREDYTEISITAVPTQRHLMIFKIIPQ